MSAEKFKSKLTAILSADAKGYSRLMGTDEEVNLRTGNRLHSYHGHSAMPSPPALPPSPYPPPFFFLALA